MGSVVRTYRKLLLREVGPCIRKSSVGSDWRRLLFFPMVRKTGEEKVRKSRSQNPVPELYPLRFKDLPRNIFGKLENYLQLPSKGFSSKTSLAIIYNTTDYLEHSSLEKIQQQYQVPIFPLGPLYKISSASYSSLLEEDMSCLAWLDKQSCNSIIYVSLGSIAAMDVIELVEMAWGLANSQQPFLWVVRPHSIRGAEWIEELLEALKENISERSYIAKWAPQKEVLAHEAVGGFLSHCGWNSTLESISEGIPIICRPCFGDQRVNARYVSHVWRVGLELEGELERGEIERAVRRVTVDEEGIEMRERAKNLKETIKALHNRRGFLQQFLEPTNRDDHVVLIKTSFLFF